MQIVIFYFESPKPNSKELHTHIFNDEDDNELIEQYAQEAYEEYVENWFDSSLKKENFETQSEYCEAYNAEYQKFYDSGCYHWIIYTENEFERNKLEIKDKFTNKWQWESLLDDIAEYYENYY